MYVDGLLFEGELVTIGENGLNIVEAGAKPEDDVRQVWVPRDVARGVAAAGMFGENVRVHIRIEQVPAAEAVAQ